MPIKLVIFDLDGTLCDLLEIHRQCFLEALYQVTNISMTPEEHDAQFHSLPTKEKMRKIGILHQYDAVNVIKQEKTLKLFENIQHDQELVDIISALRSNYNVWCASNSSPVYIEKVLRKLGILSMMNGILGNSDVINSKPSPEMFFKVCAIEGIKLSETLIVEDSKVGEAAIDASGAHKLMVKNRQDLSLKKLLDKIKKIDETY